MLKDKNEMPEFVIQFVADTALICKDYPFCTAYVATMLVRTFRRFSTHGYRIRAYAQKSQPLTNRDRMERLRMISRYC